MDSDLKEHNKHNISDEIKLNYLTVQNCKDRTDYNNNKKKKCIDYLPVSYSADDNQK